MVNFQIEKKIDFIHLFLFSEQNPILAKNYNGHQPRMPEYRPNHLQNHEPPNQPKRTIPLHAITRKLQNRQLRPQQTICNLFKYY